MFWDWKRKLLRLVAKKTVANRKHRAKRRGNPPEVMQLEPRCLLAPITPGNIVNISRLQGGNEAESTIAIDPSNPDRLFSAVMNLSRGTYGNGFFVAHSQAAGVWTGRQFATGLPGNDSLPAAAHDPQAAFDKFGNLYLAYLTNSTALQRGAATKDSTAGTLKDADPIRQWATNQWTGMAIEILDGTGKGQVRQISTNTKDTITIIGNWTTTPDDKSAYKIFNLGRQAASPLAYAGTAAKVNGAATLNDDTAEWLENSLGGELGRYIKITAGKGAGQFRRIIGNTKTSVTVAEPWGLVPDETSKYQVLGGTGGLVVTRSKDGGKNFTFMRFLDRGEDEGFLVDYPSIATGPGAGGEGTTVWVSWVSSKDKVAATGAVVNALDNVGDFQEPQYVDTVPSTLPLDATPHIDIGPRGQIMVVLPAKARFGA